MLQNRSIVVFTVLGIILSSASCSNNTGNKQKVKKHRVENVVPSTARKDYASLKEVWELTKVDETAAVVAKKNIVTEQIPLIKKKVKPKPRVVVQRKSVVKRQAKKQVRRVYQKPRRPVNYIRYASLSGDYANNKQTHMFINKMVSQHGFDRGYLNYLLSHAQATPFLKRMAYRDAFGSKKSKKKRKPRAGRWNRYRGNFLTKKTINKGVQFWKQNRVALKRAEQIYGVPQEYILGIIGVETRYGGNVGKNKAIEALAAMGFNNPRRGKYFRSELEAYLLMTRKEGLDPLKPMASYAGALGLSQFMPSNIKRYAVDHDRSGTVNLWTPHDAIGSVANYFKKHGWRTGGTVAVPAKSKNKKYRTLKTGFKSRHSLTRLKNSGVAANYLGNISGKVSLIKLNSYSGDELWIGGHNFYVITRYNHSSHYAMAVHQLAQEIKKRIPSNRLLRQAAL